MEGWPGAAGFIEEQFGELEGWSHGVYTDEAPGNQHRLRSAEFILRDLAGWTGPAGLKGVAIEHLTEDMSIMQELNDDAAREAAAAATAAAAAAGPATGEGADPTAAATAAGTPPAGH